ncbi:MAG: NAD-dependent epimerase/dehydratase family protein [Chloroflexi bacterium]|nr:NAD-dependent epimerase/dehydratase family protein [Chloroflexota bacterium]MCL5076419.1 NAD-dependent epimerase/dehydratase family protein [Chloroflexota bacterium]
MIFVTGATGFVGHHLIEELTLRNQQVRCLVRRSSKVTFLQQVGAELIYGSLEEPYSYKDSLGGVDTVIHLAAIISTPNPAHFKRVNLEGTQNLLRACLHSSIKRFIYISTINVLLEDKTAYAASKLEAEGLVLHSPLPVTVLRPSLVYGEYDTKNIRKLIDLCLKYPIIPIVGDGNYRLQPVYVKDIVASILAVLENEATVGKVYNIAGPTVVTFNQLVDLICAILRVKRIKLHIPLAAIEILDKAYRFALKRNLLGEQLLTINRDKLADIRSAVVDFGYHPLTLSEGIAQTIAKWGSADGRIT